MAETLTIRTSASTDVIKVVERGPQGPAGAAQAVNVIELTPNGTTTITTSQLPARGIAYIEGGGSFTVNLPTPDKRQSGLTFSIKVEHESGVTGDVFITVVHNASDLLTGYELDEDESSLDFLWDGYRWTYSSSNWLYSYPNRRLVIPPLSGTLALTESADNVFRVVGSADATKKVAFEVDGLTTGTTRTLTVPDASGTIALTSNFAAPPAIGSTTPAAGSFTTLAANNGTITASAPVLDLSQTWNNAAVTFTGLRFNVTNTASVATSNTLELQNNGTAVFFVRRTGGVIADSITCTSGGAYRFSANALTMFLQRDYAISWSNDPTAAGSSVTSDLILRRDAAGVLGQRDLANPQAFRLYNTTNAGLTNFERGFMRWSSNVLQIGTEKLGTGSARALEFQTDGTTRLALSTDGLVQFAGTTSSFPALKRSSTTLQVRLADDSAFAPFGCAGLTLNGDLTASTRNIVTDTTTGTKIGTATTQKIGFFNATPVVQQAAIADATDAATTQARLNDLLATMRTFGLIAT